MKDNDGNRRQSAAIESTADAGNRRQSELRLFDTHCHFESADPAEIAAILRRAKTAGVAKLMAVGGSSELNAAAIAAAEVKRKSEEGRSAEVTNLPDVIFALGYDRDQIGKVAPSTLRLPLSTSTPSPFALCSDRDQIGKVDPSTLRLQLSTSTPSPRAIGEIGLDYHYSPQTREKQMELFAAQLELARSRDLPVVIHTREADEDTVALLKEIPSRGIIHCYTGTPDFAKRFLDLGFFISFSGIVTFRAAENVRDSFRVVPRDRLLIETDSPYLAPVPVRGRPNEPAFLRHTCDFLHSYCNMSAEEFAELTFANAERILG